MSEQEKCLNLGLIKSSNTSNKALVSQQFQGSKNPKKQHPKKNGPKANNKSPKHNKVAQPNNEKATQHDDKANKNKGRKTNKYSKFFYCDGHIEWKCFK